MGTLLRSLEMPFLTIPDWFISILTNLKYSEHSAHWHIERWGWELSIAPLNDQFGWVFDLLNLIPIFAPIPYPSQVGGACGLYVWAWFNRFLKNWREFLFNFSHSSNWVYLRRSITTDRRVKQTLWKFGMLLLDGFAMFLHGNHDFTKFTLGVVIGQSQIIWKSYFWAPKM